MPRPGARLQPSSLARWSKGWRPALAAGLLLALAPATGRGEDAPGSLSLARAVQRARAASPGLASAREALAAARGEERQAAAFPNPVLGFVREQTFRDDRSNQEYVVALEQSLELGGQRGLRLEAARQQRRAAEAELRLAELELDFEVTEAFALAVAADERAEQARRLAEAFALARETGRPPGRAADADYDAPRLALEATRYAALRAQASRERRAARIALAEHLEAADRMAALLQVQLEAPPLGDPPALSLDELRDQALRGHPQLVAAAASAESAGALGDLAQREWVPTPSLVLGYKNESPDGDQDFQGYVAELAVPLPLWDRSQGAREAAEARARGAQADLRALRRRVVREVESAWVGYAAAAAELDALQPGMDADAAAAVESARAAYARGRIGLVEWLDAVRAYQEAASAYTDLRADLIVQRAALERAVGAPLD